MSYCLVIVLDIVVRKKCEMDSSVLWEVMNRKVFEITRVGVIHVVVRRMARGQVEASTIDVAIAITAVIISILEVGFIQIGVMRTFELGASLVSRLRRGGGHGNLGSCVEVIGVIVMFSPLAIRQRGPRYVVGRHGNVGSSGPTHPCRIHGGGLLGLTRALGKGSHNGFITDNESTQKVD